MLIDDALARPKPARRRRSGLGRLGAAFLASALVGLLVAAAVLPGLSLAGLAVKRSADEFLLLPAGFENPQLSLRSRVLASDGSLIAYLYTENRIPATLAEVPPHVVDALLAVEDARFYEHDGVDVQGTLRAAAENAAAGSVQQGGSTLTQQYVKNALIVGAANEQEQQAASEQSVQRKLREARLALALEQTLSKDEILERYLNIAYFGNGAYGVATAANLYFSKPVGELTVAEGAMLVGLVQSPSRYDPLDDLPAAVARRDVVLRRMVDTGALTPAGLAEAQATAPEVRPAAVSSGCEAPGVTAPFFCDYVRRALESGPLGASLGATRAERQQRLLTGGLTITTTLNPGAQAVAEQALLGAVPAEDPSGVAATFTAVEPGTGEVRSLAVNRVFSEDEGPGRTKLNLALGGSSGMQGGSTFKVFVLAAAVEQGLPLDTTFDAPASYESDVFVNCDGNTCDEKYVVNNAGDSAAGRHDIVSGTHASVNTFYLQLMELTGVERPVEIAESMGLRQFSAGSPSAPLLRGGSFVLGTNEISPLDLTAAYAAFAASGTYCPPRPVTSITDAAGADVALPPAQCTQALAPEVADTVTAVLRGNIDGGSRSRTGARASIGRPAAGKTGSTNGSRAAWFAGYTPQLAAAVWVGKPVPEDLRNLTIGDRFFRQVYGGTLPAPIWAQAMEGIHTGVPEADMPDIVFSDPQPELRAERAEREAREERDARDEDDQDEDG